MKFLLVISSFILLTGFIRETSGSKRDATVIRNCGSHTVEFMRWECSEAGFKLPYDDRFSRVIRKRGMRTDRDLEPFLYVAVKCCHFGCKMNDYRWMCEYQKQVNQCEGANPSTAKRRQCKVDAIKSMDLPQ